MLIEKIMKQDVITVSPSTSVSAARNLLTQHRIRHLPVLNEWGAIVGLVSDRDIRQFLPSPLDADEEHWKTAYATPVSSIMNEQFPLCSPSDFIEDIATTFIREKINCMPVVSASTLVGIVTTSDLLRRLVSLTCSNIPSSRIDLRGPKTNETILLLTELIAQSKLPLISFIIIEEESSLDSQIYVLRVRTMDTKNFTLTLQAKGFDILCP
ncbi:MAG: CBS and ACT domain-containing protein [Bacilli bacterium]